MSAALAEADIAYFVDASFDPQITRFRVTPIGVTSTSRLADPHVLGPAKILGLTAPVYHHVPKAYMVEIAARDFGFGQELSPCSQTAVRRVTRWLRARLSRRGARSEAVLVRNRGDWPSSAGMVLTFVFFRRSDFR